MTTLRTPVDLVAAVRCGQTTRTTPRALALAVDYHFTPESCAVIERVTTAQGRDITRSIRSLGLVRTVAVAIEAEVDRQARALGLSVEEEPHHDA